MPELPKRHVVALERRLSETEVARVAVNAAPLLGIDVERLQGFLERKGTEPLTASLDAWASQQLADALRSVGAPVRQWTAPLLGPTDPRETWSDVRIGRPDTPVEPDPDADDLDARVRDTLVIRAEPLQEGGPRWLRIAVWSGVTAFWAGLITATTLLLG